MKRSILKALGIAVTGALVLGATTSVCFAKAKATSSSSKVTAYAYTRADNQKCEDNQSALGSPTSTSANCTSSTSKSNAAAHAYASNGVIRRVGARVQGGGRSWRADKPMPGVGAVSGNDTLDVQLTASGGNWTVPVWGQLVATAGAGEYEFEEIYVAIYPNEAAADADAALDGTGAIYAWKARFLNATTVTLPTLAVTNQFSLGDFTVGGGTASVNKSYVLPVVGLDADAVLLSQLGAGGGEPVPALSTWVLLGLTALLLAVGAGLLIRRRTATA